MVENKRKLICELLRRIWNNIRTYMGTWDYTPLFLIPFIRYPETLIIYTVLCSRKSEILIILQNLKKLCAI